ncbi:MAG: TetR/AcrR family transcriptional regulator [Pseudorhodoplanes sp.]|jgi:TetR/AcrR family transcriptional regulator|nr:TetR/AcrR family transcriptional regulator [Pseudorhodoplanes sp.]
MKAVKKQKTKSSGRLKSPGKAEDNATRRTLIEVAKKEFARNGFYGSRVDEIAKAAKINKQLIYYYFGEKSNLYLAVLEDAYADIRAHESALDLDSLDPIAAMKKLVAFTFDYVMQNRTFVQLLTNENLMEAKHIKRSKVIKSTHTPVVDLVSQTLARGEQARIFRSDVKPVQLYISIAGLCFFYSANIHTLGILFDRDLRSKDAVAERRAHIIDFVIGYLTNKAPAKAAAETPEQDSLTAFVR